MSVLIHDALFVAGLGWGGLFGFMAGTAWIVALLRSGAGEG